LLVVHSGNTTTGLSDFTRISSRDNVLSPGAGASGNFPVWCNMANREATRNPRIGERVAGDAPPSPGDDMAAEPVPVRRPGVVKDELDSCKALGASEATGMTNIGFQRKARYNTSTQEHQLDTIISPAFGDHFSANVFERLCSINE